MSGYDSFCSTSTGSDSEYWSLSLKKVVDKDAQAFRRYCQYFTKKFLHALVQSRSGENMLTFGCYSPAPADSIGLRVDEIGEVCAYLRLNFPSYPVLPNKLNVDFILHTADGYDIPLESWRMEVSYKGEQESVRTNTILCMDVSTLLKSVISAAHITPAYRYYVRNQSEDTYVVTYRIYEGAPEINLGAGSKSYNIGIVKTTRGLITVNLNYRTKMEYEKPLLSDSKSTTHSVLGETLRMQMSKSDVHLDLVHSAPPIYDHQERLQSSMCDCLKYVLSTSQDTGKFFFLVIPSATGKALIGATTVKKVEPEQVKQRKAPKAVARVPFTNLLEYSSEASVAAYSQSYSGSTIDAARPCTSRMAFSAVTALNIGERRARRFERRSSDECKENEVQLENNTYVLSNDSKFQQHQDTWAFISFCERASNQSFRFRANCFGSLSAEIEHFENMRDHFDQFVAGVTVPEDDD